MEANNSTKLADPVIQPSKCSTMSPNSQGAGGASLPFIPLGYRQVQPVRPPVSVLPQLSVSSGGPKTETTGLWVSCWPRDPLSESLPPWDLRLRSPHTQVELRSIHSVPHGVNSVKFPRFCSPEPWDPQLYPTGPTHAHSRANCPTDYW